MDYLDAIGDMIKYTTKEYPYIDIRKSKKKFRQREYEKLIIDDIISNCCDNMIENPINILENYELIHEYLSKIHNNDIYKFQLNVIRKLLIFFRRREVKYA